MDQMKLVTHFLEILPSFFCKPLEILFNKILSIYKFPSQGKHVDAIDTFKKGDTHASSNCRPVSLLSRLGKGCLPTYPTYTILIYGRVMRHICFIITTGFKLQVRDISAIFSSVKFPRVLSPFRGGRIAYLNDPDSYADWSFNTPGRVSQARQVEV